MPIVLSPEDAVYFALNLNGIIRNAGIKESNKVRLIEDFVRSKGECDPEQLRKIILVKCEGELNSGFHLAITTEQLLVFKSLVALCGGRSEISIEALDDEVHAALINKPEFYECVFFAPPPPMLRASSSISSSGSTIEREIRESLLLSGIGSKKRPMPLLLIDVPSLTSSNSSASATPGTMSPNLLSPRNYLPGSFKDQQEQSSPMKLLKSEPENPSNPPIEDSKLKTCSFRG